MSQTFIESNMFQGAMAYEIYIQELRYHNRPMDPMFWYCGILIQTKSIARSNLAMDCDCQFGS